MPCYTGGELLGLIVSKRRLDLDIATSCAAELVLAVNSLNESGFIHRDIKPENILLNAKGHLVLSDFELPFICNLRNGSLRG